jgi:hypothetical protein
MKLNTTRIFTTRVDGYWSEGHLCEVEAELVFTASQLTKLREMVARRERLNVQLSVRERSEIKGDLPQKSFGFMTACDTVNECCRIRIVIRKDA